MEQNAVREYLDRTPGQVNQLTQSLDNLAIEVDRNRKDVSEAMLSSAQRLADSLDRSSAAAEQHAAQLAKWTKWLAFATVALVVTGIAQIIVTLAK